MQAPLTGTARLDWAMKMRPEALSGPSVALAEPRF